MLIGLCLTFISYSTEDELTEDEEEEDEGESDLSDESEVSLKFLLHLKFIHPLLKSLIEKVHH